MYGVGDITQINDKYIFTNGERRPVNKEDIITIYRECEIMIMATKINMNEAHALVEEFARRGHGHRERMLNAKDRFNKEFDEMHANEEFSKAIGASEIISFLHDRMNHYYKIQTHAARVMKDKGWA